MMKLSKMAGIPDDMVLGLVIGNQHSQTYFSSNSFFTEAVLGYNMTEVSTMTSHLFSLKQIPTNSLRKQVTQTRLTGLNLCLPYYIDNHQLWNLDYQR